MLALAAYEDGICKCGCGLPMKDAHTDGVFKVDHFTCYAARAVDRAKKADEDKAKRDRWPKGWDEHRHYYATSVDVPERGADAN